MFFPAAVGRARACLPCIEQEGHRLRHSVLGSRKRELVGAIESLPRRSAQREELFLTMHRERRAAAVASPLIRQWEDRLNEEQRKEADEQILFDRELFYAIQSRDRLEMMIGKYRDALDR
jgi:hypothetical protein